MIFQKKLQGTFHWIPIGYHQQGQDATMWYIWWICLCEFRMAFWCYHGLSMDWMGNDSKIWGRWVSNHQSNGILWPIIRGLERTMMGIFHGIPKRSSLKSIHLMGMFTVEIFTSKSTQWICLWISRSLGSQGLNLHWRRNLRFFMVKCTWTRKNYHGWSLNPDVYVQNVLRSLIFCLINACSCVKSRCRN